ncbi:MAG: alpha-N-arabinofuranosidase [Prevotella sp.]|nr:alpha-N-arabinofuranosidase [Prevotella sp.]
MKKLMTVALLAIAGGVMAAEHATATLHADQGKYTISRDIYGQFAEHLGSCIYGGLWVGENSPIPNINGYRKDVFEAIKQLQVPVLRWPGGCFADDYHWMDGIGPRENRPTLRNNTWGGTIEDNSFGTHEFLNLCEMLGCEPYICGNVGSGTVKEMAQWAEYMTSSGDTPMARLRRKNGRENPWRVKYFGIGNEAWGCGGNMTPEYYSNEYRKFNTYLRDQPGNKLFRIASGASDYNYDWTRVLMKNIGRRMDGISVHFYTVKNWQSKGKATAFTPDEYYLTLEKCLDIDKVVKKHCDIMDETDPEKKIALMVDEWGTWWDEEAGTIRGHLYQQNSLRDAMVASLMLNVFHKYTDRVRMCNIAQMVNVLQAMILTDQKGSGHMVLTPTYHVFEMYRPFQEAMFLPMTLTTDSLTTIEGKSMPLLSSSAARCQDGSTVIALSNASLTDAKTLDVTLEGMTAKTVTGRILTSKDAQDFNDFEHPEVVVPHPFKDAQLKKNVLSVKLPAKSIVVLTLK